MAKMLARRAARLGGDGAALLDEGLPMPSAANDDGSTLEELANRLSPPHRTSDEEVHAIARQHLKVAEEIRELLRSGHAHTVMPKDTIIFYGKRCYSINDHRALALSEPESNVLESFLDCRAMNLPDLIEKSGQENARKLLLTLTTKCDGVLAPAIFCPDGRGDGGYHVRIMRAPELAE